jgi:hypothetical protein
VAVNVALAFTCVWLFTFVVGSWDPTFSHSAAAGAGYTASAFIVLIGFYGFAFAAASWTGYPFENETAPTSSLAQWFMAAFITVVGVVVLVYPNFNLHLVGNAPLKLVDALGWVYSSIVVVLVAAQLWENWPWAGVGNRHVRALAAVLTTLGGGLLVYWLLSLVVKAVVPADIKALPTFSASQETAELGVCFSFWALFWGLVVGGWPHQYNMAVNRCDPDRDRHAPGDRHVRPVHAGPGYAGPALPSNQRPLWRQSAQLDGLAHPRAAVVHGRVRQLRSTRIRRTVARQLDDQFRGQSPAVS